MSKKLPCIDCIALPMCKSFVKEQELYCFTYTFALLTKKCSLISDFARASGRRGHSYSIYSCKVVVVYLSTGVTPEKDGKEGSTISFR